VADRRPVDASRPDALARWDRQVLASAVDVVLVGCGPQRPALEQLAAGLTNLRFTDGGASGDDGTAGLALRAADLLVVVDRAGARSAPVDGRLAACLEAGRPVVAATDPDSPVADELRRAGSPGIRVDAGDASALADAVVDLQADPRRRGTMSRAALRYARVHVGRSAFLHRLDAVLDAALGAALDRRHVPGNNGRP
jgi:glycosyltransferase involved in cell wall biosynthesis